MKLFKLLFFLDSRVYRETGKTVTELKYFAWKMGPVPKSLFNELDSPQKDFLESISIQRGSTSDADFANEKRLTFGIRKSFDPSWFTNRELRIMKEVVEIFKPCTSDQMSTSSHEAGTPWHQIFVVEKKENGQIPFLLSIDGKAGSITREQAELIENESKELKVLGK